MPRDSETQQRPGKNKKGGNKRNNNNNVQSAAETAAGSRKGVTPDDVDDVASVNSDFSCSTAALSDDEDEELSDLEKYETGLKVAIELAQEKSLKLRLEGLCSLKKLLQATNPCLSTALEGLYVTLGAIVEASLKRKGSSSSSAEKTEATKVAAALTLASLTLEEDVTEEIYTQLQPVLLQVCQDPTVSPPVREAACRAVAVIALYSPVEYKDIQKSINALHSVFSMALPKGDGELPSLKPASLTMHAAAVQGFLLLLPRTDTNDLQDRAADILTEMMALLETKDLDMRCEGGLGIALVYELVRGITNMENFRWRRERELLAVLAELATDSHKHRGKKERKQQRLIFRSILQQVKEDEYDAHETVEFRCSRGRGYLEVYSWSVQLQYEAVCAALEQGVNTHFLFNTGLRAQFELTDADLILEEPTSRDKRAENRRLQDAYSKQRRLQRHKNRDNRTQQRQTLLLED